MTNPATQIHPLSIYILKRSEFSSADLRDYPVLWLTRIHRLL